MAYFITHPVDGSASKHLTFISLTQCFKISHQCERLVVVSLMWRLWHTAHHVDCTQMRWSNLVKCGQVLRWSTFITLSSAVSASKHCHGCHWRFAHHAGYAQMREKFIFERMQTLLLCAYIAFPST
eukprot:8155640-Ditylum_brightwellii.AAC.1